MLPRAEARCRISLFTARLLWAEASLGGRLGTAFLLMQCVCGFACGLQPGAGGCKPQRPHFNKFLHAKKFVYKKSSSAVSP
jgi:hypothetical protein